MYTFNIMNEGAFHSTRNKLGRSAVVKGHSKGLDMLDRSAEQTSFILMKLA